jgi:hypothetical protein
VVGGMGDKGGVGGSGEGFDEKNNGEFLETNCTSGSVGNG